MNCHRINKLCSVLLAWVNATIATCHGITEPLATKVQGFGKHLGLEALQILKKNAADWPGGFCEVQQSAFRDWD